MNNKLFNLFVEGLVEVFKEKYPEYEVVTKESIENNGMEECRLIVRKDDDTCMPAFRLRPMFDDHMKAIKQMADYIAEMAETCGTAAATHDVKTKAMNAVRNWRDLVQLTLVRGEDVNEAFLADKPHRSFLDMAIVYKLVLQQDEDGLATVTITDSLLQEMGCTLDELHQAALANTQRLNPMEIMNLSERMRQISHSEEPSEDVPVWILSVENKVDGAAAILYPNVLEAMSDVLGGEGFYVLPSSVNEVLFLPKEGNDVEALREMVECANNAELEEKEILSYSVYEYTRGKGLSVAS